MTALVSSNPDEKKITALSGQFKESPSLAGDVFDVLSKISSQEKTAFKSQGFNELTEYDGYNKVLQKTENALKYYPKMDNFITAVKYNTLIGDIKVHPDELTDEKKTAIEQAINQIMKSKENDLQRNIKLARDTDLFVNFDRAYTATRFAGKPLIEWKQIITGSTPDILANVSGKTEEIPPEVDKKIDQPAPAPVAKPILLAPSEKSQVYIYIIDEFKKSAGMKTYVLNENGLLMDLIHEKINNYEKPDKSVKMSQMKKAIEKEIMANIPTIEELNKYSQERRKIIEETDKNLKIEAFRGNILTYQSPVVTETSVKEETADTQVRVKEEAKKPWWKFKLW